MANRRTRIVFPILAGYEVRVIAAKDLVRTGRRLNAADLTGAEAAFITVEGQPVGWLVVKPDVSADVIAHEAAHAIRALFTYTGVAFDDEAFAYHLGYLVGKIHDFIRRA